MTSAKNFLEGLTPLLDRVLERCLLAAISILRYPASAREDRKHMLLQELRELLFGENKLDGALDALKRRVWLLLREKEERAPPGMKKIAGSLIQQATSEANLASHSTFNKSVYALITAKLTPILGSLISFADTNHNLSILLKGDAEFRHLWLEMLTNEDITHFTYEEALRLQGHGDNVADQQTPESQIELDVQFLPRGQLLLRNPLFPFSFIVNQTIESLLRTPFEDSDSQAARAIALCRHFANTPVGSCLLWQCHNNADQLISDYRSDFLGMVHQASCSEELDAVEHVLRAQLRLLLDEMDKPAISDADPSNELSELQRALLPMPAMHLVYEQLASRLQLVRRVFGLDAQHPQFARDLSSFLTGVTNRSELLSNFDLLLARRALEYLVAAGIETCQTLKPQQPTEPVSSPPTAPKFDLTQWNDFVKRAELVVYSCLAAVEEPSELRVREIGNCRHLLSRVLVVHLFLKNMHGCQFDELPVDAIWNFFEKPEDANFRNTPALNKLEDYLNFCTRPAMKKLIGYCFAEN